MKIINVSDKPYSFTFDSFNFGPFASGQVVDLPDEIATHALRKSAILDDVGDVIGWAMAALGTVEKSKVAQMAIYACPFVAYDQCTAAPFKGIEDLRKHMDEHWGPSEAAPMVPGAPLAQGKPSNLPGKAPALRS